MVCAGYTKTWDLASGELVRLDGARGTTLRVTRGTLWITLQNDTRDIVLTAGDSYTIDRGGLTLIEATQEAEDAWVQTIVEMSQFNVKFLEACTPGYYNNEGRPAERSVRNGSYGGGSPGFIRVLEKWRSEGSMSGLDVSA